MAVYTVFEPPLRSGDARRPDNFVFVRDGFFWSAFLFAPLWMLRHRLWLTLLLYVAFALAVGTGAQFLRLSPGAIVAVAFFTSLLIGLEASTLRRWSLARRKWTNVGVVVGDDLELAERRFFDAWLRHELPSRNPAPGAAGNFGSSGDTEVIGLFPRPEARP